MIGIDDWAWKRGHRYGSVVCDLERREIVDVLPDREAAPVEAWLADHPEVEMAANASRPSALAANSSSPTLVIETDAPVDQAAVVAEGGQLAALGAAEHATNQAIMQVERSIGQLGAELECHRHQDAAPTAGGQVA